MKIKEYTPRGMKGIKEFKQLSKQQRVKTFVANLATCIRLTQSKIGRAVETGELGY